MKNLPLIYSFIFMVNIANSQNLSVGTHLGLNSSQISGNYGYKNLNSALDFNPINNATYGVFLNYGLNKNFAIQPELNYQTRGFEYNTKQGFISDSGNQGNAKLNYIDVPILFNYSYGKKLKVIFNAGPSINILVSGGNYDYSASSAIPPGYTKYYMRDVKQDFTKVGFSIVGGIGLKYEINARFAIFSEYRVNYSISKSAANQEYADSKNQDTWYYKNTHFKDNSFQIGLSYRLKKIK